MEHSDDVPKIEAVEQDGHVNVGEVVPNRRVLFHAFSIGPACEEEATALVDLTCGDADEIAVFQSMWNFNANNCNVLRLSEKHEHAYHLANALLRHLAQRRTECAFAESLASNPYYKALCKSDELDAKFLQFAKEILGKFVQPPAESHGFLAQLPPQHFEDLTEGFGHALVAAILRVVNSHKNIHTCMVEVVDHDEVFLEGLVDMKMTEGEKPTDAVELILDPGGTADAADVGCKRKVQHNNDNGVSVKKQSV